VALDRAQAIELARALRNLRESTWPDREVTQLQLAKALSWEGRVAGPTLSSWESLTNPKTPPLARVSAYARFFCTERSLEGEPHLIPEDQLTPEELDRFQELESRLLRRFHEEPKLQHIFRFDVGPVIVICPDAPEEVRGSLAKEDDPNFTELLKYGDQDALIQLYGHLRAENPNLDVFYKLASEVVPDDYAGHVILLGGIGWNKAARRIGKYLGKIPIQQIDVTDLPEGDIFQVEAADGAKSFYYPESEEVGGRKELAADVAYIARLRNPFQFDRTLTICNGIHSRGVLGAVRCFTDPSVREQNEKYLADRFPEGEFAMLLRVRVVGNETLSPDLRDPTARLYEWEPDGGGKVTEAGIAASQSVAAIASPKLTPVAG